MCKNLTNFKIDLLNLKTLVYNKKNILNSYAYTLENIIKKNHIISILKKIYQVKICFNHRKNQSNLLEEDLIYKIHLNNFKKITLDRKIVSIIKSNKKTVYEENNEFNLSPGLYRIVNPTARSNHQFSVKSGNVLEDIQNYMYMFSRGNRDDGLPYSEILRIIRTQRSVLTCGYVSSFMKKFLEEHYKGIQIRLIHYLTKQQYNKYNDGHTVLEYYSEKYRKWVLVDFTRSSLFFNKDLPCSAYEVYKTRHFEQKIFNNIQVDVNFSDCGYNYGFFEDYSYSEQAFKEFHDRIFGSIIIAQEKKLYTLYDEIEYMNRLKTIYSGIFFLTEEELMNTFYGIKE